MFSNVQQSFVVGCSILGGSDFWRQATLRSSGLTPKTTPAIANATGNEAA
jgi:hypothetical protein